ncbi:hypothetical protein K2W90_03590 [Candidatus Babeliales bacterium]|nr:hypothetical protein [Candidatus Babeliales bacterium]
MSRSITQSPGLRTSLVLVILLLSSPTTAFAADAGLSAEQELSPEQTVETTVLPDITQVPQEQLQQEQPLQQSPQPQLKEKKQKDKQPKPKAIPPRFLKLLRKEINRTVQEAQQEETKAPGQRRKRSKSMEVQKNKRHVGGRNRKRKARERSKQTRKPKVLHKQAAQEKMQQLEKHHNQSPIVVQRHKKRTRPHMQQKKLGLPTKNIRQKLDRKRERIAKNVATNEYRKELEAKKIAGTLTQEEATMLEVLEKERETKKRIRELLLKDPKTLTPQERRELMEHERAQRLKRNALRSEAAKHAQGKKKQRLINMGKYKKRNVGNLKIVKEQKAGHKKPKIKQGKKAKKKQGKTLRQAPGFAKATTGRQGKRDKRQMGPRGVMMPPPPFPGGPEANFAPLPGGPAMEFAPEQAMAYPQDAQAPLTPAEEAQYQQYLTDQQQKQQEPAQPELEQADQNQPVMPAQAPQQDTQAPLTAEEQALYQQYLAAQQQPAQQAPDQQAPLSPEEEAMYQQYLAAQQQGQAPAQQPQFEQPAADQAPQPAPSRRNVNQGLPPGRLTERAVAADVPEGPDGRDIVQATPPGD